MAIFINGDPLKDPFADGQEDGGIFVVRMDGKSNPEIESVWIINNHHISSDNTYLRGISFGEEYVNIKEKCSLTQGDKFLMIRQFKEVGSTLIYAGSVDGKGLKISDVIKMRKIIDRGLPSLNLRYDSENSNFLMDPFYFQEQLKEVGSFKTIEVKTDTSGPLREREVNCCGDELESRTVEIKREKILSIKIEGEALEYYQSQLKKENTEINLAI